MSNTKKKSLLHKKHIIILSVFLGWTLLLMSVFFVYMGDYYHAEDIAFQALNSDDTVTVTETESGWLFNGASDDDLLIFYSRAKVEEEAYAPLLHRIAESGTDAYLVKMPFHFAMFGINSADDIINGTDYKNYYIGGHSLGGAMAAVYASDNGEKLSGLVMLAAYPTKELNSDLIEITVLGSNDTVVSLEKIEEGKKYQTDNAVEYVIKGGNHALFGNYGEQKGDGTAMITGEDQQGQTVRFITDVISEKIK